MKSNPETLEELMSVDSAVLEGDVMLSNDRNAVGHIWATMEIPYVISPALASRTDDILSAMKMVSENTCVSFHKRTSEKDYLLFKSSHGCASYVGFIGGEQPVFVGPPCIVGNIAHEILHALGFHHEHTRTDREQHITILSHNIMEANGLPTIVPNDGVEEMGQRVRMTQNDIERVRHLYSCDLHHGVTIRWLTDPADLSLAITVITTMAAAPDAPCLSELGGRPSRNISLVSVTRPCNRSTVRTSNYSPQATAAFAITITSMMLLTIVGNILVIIAVLTSRSLKGAQNLFLVSLAAADILVATLIIPFSLANELQGYWAFSSIWCEIYLALDVLFCTSSIAHLCAIALDRYLSISRPVSYGAKRTPVRIKAAIIVVWLMSAVISFPPLLTLDKSKGGEEVCELNNERWYILYSTIGSFFAPCVIMILVYVRIYQIAKQHTRCPPGHKNKAAVAGSASVAISEPVTKLAEQIEDQGGTTVSQREKVSTKTLSSLQKLPETMTSQDTQHYPPNLSIARAQKSTYTHSIPQHGSQTLSAVPQTQPNKREAQVDAHHDNTSSSGSEVELEICKKGFAGKEEANKTDEQSKRFSVQMPNLACRYKNTMATSSGTKLVREETPKVQGTSISRRKAMVNREKRFTFVLAVVMGVFVICWFPFFLSYSLKAVCPKTCSTPKPLFTFFFWIGYCNSCLNPVIYTIFNKDFRKAFKRILCRYTKGTFF
ncbi:hypothetical protein PAMA_007465 [Pampus argenteus]